MEGTPSQVKMEDFNSDHIPWGPNCPCRGGSQQPSLLDKGDTLYPTPNSEQQGPRSGTLAVLLEVGLLGHCSLALHTGREVCLNKVIFLFGN